MLVQLFFDLVLVALIIIILIKVANRIFFSAENDEKALSERERKLAELREKDEALTNDVEVTEEIVNVKSHVDKKAKTLEKLDSKLKE